MIVAAVNVNPILRLGFRFTCSITYLISANHVKNIILLFSILFSNCYTLMFCRRSIKKAAPQYIHRRTTGEQQQQYFLMVIIVFSPDLLILLITTAY